MSIVLITGASAGFGAALARSFAAAGYRVIGAARRETRLLALQEQLGKLFLPLPMDLSQPASIDDALARIPPAWQAMSGLINNAGLALGITPAQQSRLEDWHTMIQTNISGLVHLTHRLLPGMLERNRGHILNIGSTAGSWPYPGANVYGASKAFVKQFSLNLRADLAGSAVRVSNIEPGLSGGTEFSHVRLRDAAAAERVYENVTPLGAQDIADTVLWVYQRPPHVNINRIELMPTAQSFAGLSVHRDASE